MAIKNDRFYLIKISKASEKKWMQGLSLLWNGMGHLCFMCSYHIFPFFFFYRVLMSLLFLLLLLMLLLLLLLLYNENKEGRKEILNFPFYWMYSSHFIYPFAFIFLSLLFPSTLEYATKWANFSAYECVCAAFFSFLIPFHKYVIRQQNIMDAQSQSSYEY